MQDRQTQVLALPARAEGNDKETEGILKEKKTPPVRTEIHGIPRNSLHSGLGDSYPCQMWRMHGGALRAVL